MGERAEPLLQLPLKPERLKTGYICAWRTETPRETVRREGCRQHRLAPALCGTEFLIFAFVFDVAEVRHIFKPSLAS